MASLSFWSAAAMLSLALCAGEEATVRIGSTAVKVPVPEGFVAVTPGMERLTVMFDSFVPPTNQRLLSLVTKETAEAPEEQILEVMDRTIGLQALKMDVSQRVTSAEFEKLKERMKKALANAREEMAARLPGMEAKVEENIERNFNERIDFKAGEMAAFKPHRETERELAYTMMTATVVGTEGAKGDAHRTVATTSLLHVNGWVLYLFVAGPEAELEWTRKIAGEMADGILKGNGPDAQTAAFEAGSSVKAARSGSPSAARGALMVGMMAMGISLARMYARHRRNPGTGLDHESTTKR